jgi:hypothetical protein
MHFAPETEGLCSSAMLAVAFLTIPAAALDPDPDGRIPLTATRSAACSPP